MKRNVKQAGSSGRKVHQPFSTGIAGIDCSRNHGHIENLAVFFRAEVVNISAPS